jgi:hypothetical protein
MMAIHLESDGKDGGSTLRIDVTVRYKLPHPRTLANLHNKY